MLPGEPGRTITVVDGWLRATGHGAGGATAVIITETGGTPTTIVSATAGALRRTRSPGSVIPTSPSPTWAPPCVRARRLIGRTDSDLTTSHALDYHIEYTVTG